MKQTRLRTIHQVRREILLDYINASPENAQEAARLFAKTMPHVQIRDMIEALNLESKCRERDI